MEEQKPQLESLREEIPELVRQGGMSAQPIEEKFVALTQQVDECGVSLDFLDKKIDEQLDKAKEFNDACDGLKEWLPIAQETPALVDPIGSEPVDILKQVEDLKVI